MSATVWLVLVVVGSAVVLWHYWRWMWATERGEGTRKLDCQRALFGFVILAAIFVRLTAPGNRIYSSKETRPPATFDLCMERVIDVQALIRSRHLTRGLAASGDGGLT